MAQRRAILDLRSQNASRLVYELLSEEIPLPPPSPIPADAPPKRPTSASVKKPGPKQSTAKAWTDRTDQATALYRDIFENYSKFLSSIDNPDEDTTEFALSARQPQLNTTGRPAAGNGENRAAVKGRSVAEKFSGTVLYAGFQK
jgi:hypothetical protein